MNLIDIFKFSLMLFLLSSISAAISFSCSSGGSEGASSISADYDLDSSTRLVQSVTIGDSEISSVQSAKGSGINTIAQTTSNQNAIVSSSITSTDKLASIASSYVSRDMASIGQTVQASGQSESSISASSNSLDVEAGQEAGVLSGSMASSQIAIAGAGSVSALQASSLAGAMGYVNGEARSYDDTVKMTGGLNGIGDMSGFIAAIASGSAQASGSFQADSLESKAYSAVKSTSPDGDVYSYLSSAGELTSRLSGTADGHVTSNQDLNANEAVRVYASSISDDSSSKSYDAKGESISGSLSASAGSPAILDINLEGVTDTQSSTESLAPTPGSWVWNGFGGIITSNPYQLQAADGKIHIFAKGSDSALWDNFNGDWQGLGGVITSGPFALEYNDKIHVFVRGSDGALWDKVIGENWVGLGGYITLNPCAALSKDNGLKVFVKGGDNALWQKDLTTGEWSGLGGVIDSSPQAILGKDEKMHVLVKGSDEGLWDNVDGVWQARGGIIASDAKPVINPFDPGFIYTSIRGGDGALWYNKLDTASGTADWVGLGGLMQGTPSPVVDTDGVIHNFVRVSNGGLWDNVNGEWYNLGGIITSDPNAIRDKQGKLHVAAVGGDSALWVNTVGIGLTPTSLVGPIASDYNTIQSAVDSSSASWVVKVLPGTYKENIIIDKSLTIMGSGADNAIVDGQQGSSVFTIGSSAIVDLSGLTIRNGKASSGGGIHNYGILTVMDSTISENTADIGGGIYNDGTFNLNGCSIDHNTASQYGGGIYNYDTLNLDSNTMSYNKASTHGGAIFNDGKLDVKSGSVDHNTAQHGAGVYNWGTMTQTSGVYNDNIATGWGGGGIYNTGTVTVTGTTITGNEASTPDQSSGLGAGLWNDAGKMTVTNCVITDNKGNWGSGVYNDGLLYLTDSLVKGNVAYVSAGGVYSWGPNPIDFTETTSKISGTTISNNMAGDFGGGIYNDWGGLDILAGTVIENNQAVNGGGIYNWGTLNQNGIIRYNTASKNGGGICSDGTLNQLGGSIDHNIAAQFGGGIYSTGAVKLNSGSIDHNTAGADGGGIYKPAGSLTGNMALAHDNFLSNGSSDNISP